MKFITYIPLEVLTTPPSGRVEHFANYWWTVDPDKGALIYRGHAPQANPNRAISEKIRDSMYPGCDVVLIPHAFLKIDSRSEGS